MGFICTNIVLTMLSVEVRKRHKKQVQLDKKHK